MHVNITEHYVKEKHNITKAVECWKNVTVAILSSTTQTCPELYYYHCDISAPSFIGSQKGWDKDVTALNEFYRKIEPRYLFKI